MPVSAVIPTALKAITTTKIDELSKQRESYEISKREVIKNAERETNLLSKVQALVDGSCRIEGFHPGDGGTPEIKEDVLSGDLRNQLRFVGQAQADPSFSSAALRQIGEELSRKLSLKSQGHIQAEFFSKLVTEWLSDSQPNQSLPTENATDFTDSSSFETVGRQEMHDQRIKWESLVFNEKITNEEAIHGYLNKLFTSNEANTKALEDIRRKIRQVGARFEARSPFDSEFLEITIKGLASTDLLSEEKKAMLKAFTSNREVLHELCDVLNMRLKSLSAWSWSTGERGGIPLEMRKQLNGKYRVFMDEELLDALLLHAIGLTWAVEFKTVFFGFFNSRAWCRNGRPIPTVDRERREYFLGEGPSESFHRTVQAKRRDQYAKSYFMTMLPEHISEGARTYDGDSDGMGEAKKGGKDAVETKHSLLHLLATESLLATRIHGHFTIIRSDFKFFGPSLPHNTIFAVLRFFGISEKLIDFFNRFLKAPLRFVQDGPEGEVRTRVRGVPMSHILSDVFGEALLFCMDYAVNQRTAGSCFYRLHDDFWFWGQEQVCRKAWKAMSEFAEIMGIEFNEEKTGTVRLGQKTEQTTDYDGNSKENPQDVESDILPKGKVCWGFLYLDANTGRFLVDQSQVDYHVKELQVQLSNCHSIFSWIQAYNAYLARFFSNNFGKPSFAFGRAHVDMMIQTFARIQRALFPNSSVTDYLRRIIEDRFGVTGLPDGFFYFPIRMGGLELQNPLITLFGMRDSLRRPPEKMLELALAKDVEAYHIAFDRFQKTDTGAGLGRHSNFELARNIKGRGETFMPKDEYLRYREERSVPLAAVYTALLAVPEEKEVDKTPQIANWLADLKGDDVGGRRGSTESLVCGIHKDWSKMLPYWKWILALHGSEVVQKYGSVRIVDQATVPIGVLGLMRKGKVRWRG